MLRPRRYPPPKDGGETVARVALERILPNPLQPRKRFPAPQIERLAQSIESQGVIQPLVARPHPTRDGYFQLVAGERRLRAIRFLGWKDAPVLARTVPDDTLLECALVENLQREPLSPIEEALAYRTLLDRYGYTQENLARRVGKERSTVANMVRLLALPGLLREDLEEERLTTGHARALLGLGETARQLELRERILAKGLSVRETERLVNAERRGGRRHLPRRQEEKRPQPRDFKLLAVQEELEGRFGTRVVINRNEKPVGKPAQELEGKIEIEFYSLEDFNRLYDLLMGD